MRTVLGQECIAVRGVLSVCYASRADIVINTCALFMCDQATAVPKAGTGKLAVPRHLAVPHGAQTTAWLQWMLLPHFSVSYTAATATEVPRFPCPGAALWHSAWHPHLTPCPLAARGVRNCRPGCCCRHASRPTPRRFTLPVCCPPSSGRGTGRCRQGWPWRLPCPERCPASGSSPAHCTLAVRRRRANQCPPPSAQS